MTGRDTPIVLGGGPAGSMFAAMLAHAGHPVTLLEKAKDPHDKVCGDFLSRESLTYLEQVGISPESLGAVPVRKVRVIGPAGQSQSCLPFPAWSVTRRVLDAALLERAAGLGAHIVRAAHVCSLVREGQQWSVGLRDDRSFRAENVVLATGKLDLAGWPRPEGKQGDLVAFKMYYRLSEQQHQLLGEAVELALYPGGYTGLQQVESGMVNMTVLIRAGLVKGSGSQWEAVQQYLWRSSAHLRQRLEGATELLSKPLAVARIPYGHMQRETADGLWRVGDQAAVIPSMCGDGTAIALHSGFLAAACLLGGRSSRWYQRTLRCQLATRLRCATMLSRLLVGRPEASQWMRVFPGLLRTVATWTRIPERALRETRAMAHAGGCS